MLLNIPGGCDPRIRLGSADFHHVVGGTHTLQLGQRPKIEHRLGLGTQRAGMQHDHEIRAAGEGAASWGCSIYVYGIRQIPGADVCHFVHDRTASMIFV